MANPKAMGATAAIALAAVAMLVACGSEEDPASTQTVASLPAATAERLARQSKRIADQLDAGDTCTAAHSADDLAAAVDDADVPAELRSELEAATESLVNSVNCPPPPEPPEDEKKKEEKKKEEKKEEKKKEEKKKEEDHGDESDSGPPGPGGELPPGQEKKYEEAKLIQ
jgi:hypothetical protein